MIEAHGTLRLVAALEEGAGRSRLEAILAEPGMDLMFPALGISPEDGMKYLEAARDPTAEADLGEVERFFVSYVRELAGSRKQLLSLLHDLNEEELDLTRRAFRRTRAFLPPGCELGAPRLVVLPIMYDFRTDQETVYMDPVAALSLGPEGVCHTLAHELHHVARYRFTGENLTLMRPEQGDRPKSPREVFVEWATWLEAEGIADCASNMIETDVPALRAAAAERRHQMVNYARLLSGVLARFRDLSSQPASSTAELEGVRTQARQLAHPLGARIAGEIMETFGRSSLVECVGRPGTFLTRYNLAVTPKGMDLIDDRFLDWLSVS